MVQGFSSHLKSLTMASKLWACACMDMMIMMMLSSRAVAFSHGGAAFPKNALVSGLAISVPAEGRGRHKVETMVNWAARDIRIMSTPLASMGRAGMGEGVAESPSVEATSQGNRM